MLRVGIECISVLPECCERRGSCSRLQKVSLKFGASIFNWAANDRSPNAKKLGEGSFELNCAASAPFENLRVGFGEQEPP